MTKRPARPAPASPTTAASPVAAPSVAARPSTELDPGEMQAVLKRLKRAQGQLGGIVKMIEEGRDCQDIVMQLSAVSKAVDRAGFAVIALGLRQCIIDPRSEQVDVDAMEKLFLSLA